MSSIKGHLPSKVIFHCTLDGVYQAKLSQRINFSPFHTFLVSANSVQQNWAQAELGKNKYFWEYSLWLAIWQTSWRKFR